MCAVYRVYQCCCLYTDYVTSKLHSSFFNVVMAVYYTHIETSTICAASELPDALALLQRVKTFGMRTDLFLFFSYIGFSLVALLFLSGSTSRSVLILLSLIIQSRGRRQIGFCDGQTRLSCVKKCSQSVHARPHDRIEHINNTHYRLTTQHKATLICMYRQIIDYTSELTPETC